MTADPVIRTATSPRDVAATQALRLRVFVAEQGVPVDEEIDEFDAVSTHALAIVDGRVVGTGRMYRDDDGTARIGRMAVEASARRRGIGGELLSFLEAQARNAGCTNATLHAQTYVAAFYAGHGYEPQGEPFLEAGIEHIAMRKTLAGGRKG